MKKKNIIHNRIESSIELSNSPLCNKCPAKIYFNKNEYIKYGFGSLLPNIMIVLPPKAYNNKIYDNYLKEIFKNIIDLQYEYITFHPKCYCEIDSKNYIDKCAQFVLYEISKLKPKIIIFFGVKIPEQLYNTNNNFKLYYFKDIYSIKYNTNQLNLFREHIKQIFYDKTKSL